MRVNAVMFVFKKKSFLVGHVSTQRIVLLFSKKIRVFSCDYKKTDIFPYLDQKIDGFKCNIGHQMGPFFLKKSKNSAFFFKKGPALPAIVLDGFKCNFDWFWVVL